MNITEEQIEAARALDACAEALAWAEAEPRTWQQLAALEDDWFNWAVSHNLMPPEAAETITSVGEYISVREGATLTLPLCKSVDGYIYVREGGTLSLPACERVDGYIDVWKGTTLDAPHLKRRKTT